MNEVILKRLFMLLISVLLLVNCSRVLHKKPLSTEDITVREIRRQVKQNYLKLTAIKGRAHLTMEMPGMGVNAVSNIALKMPDLLTIEVKAGFGMGIGSVSVIKDSFTVYSAMENRVYSGNINSFDLSQFFQVKLDFGELIGLISGVPLIEESKHAILSINDNKYLISIKNDQLIKMYWVDPKKNVVSDFHLYDNNKKLIVKQEFRQFHKERGVYLPKIIKVHRPQRKERVTLMYTNRKTNGKIETKDFSLNIPKNTKKINL